MKRYLSGIVLLAVLISGSSNSLLAQVPSIVVAPIPSTCSGMNTMLHYSATSSPTSYTITWFGSPVGLPNVAPGTFLPPTNIPIVVLSTCAAGTYNGNIVISNSIGGSAPSAISVTVYSLPTVFTVSGGGSYCSGGAGRDVSLSGSEGGVLYQLYHSGLPMGSPIWGTGAAIDFGLQTLSGAYTIIANNVYTGCNSNMAGSATVSINPTPSIVSVTGGGGYCSGGAGVPVGLGASVFGIYYQLYRGSAPIGSPVAGIGMTLDFGLQTVPGFYTVVAIDSTGPCTTNMAGSATVYIYTDPVVYNVTGGGSYCSGGFGLDVGLTGSNTGFVYKLFNHSSILMGTLTGTGSALDFGLEVPDGPYTVKATNAIYGCAAFMADTANIYLIPDSTPNVTIGASPGTTVCADVVDTFRALTINGGTAPLFTWQINGAFAAYGNILVYTPHQGDNVKVIMTSNVTCATPPTVNNLVTMTVKNRYVPSIVIDAYPSLNIINGQSETLTGVIINPGVNPVYQWLVNGVIVAGANTPSFTTSAFKDGDTATFKVYGCSDTAGESSVVIHVIPRAGVTQIAAGNNNFQIIPNPNKGVFTISGKMASDNDVSVKVTDMLGKVVYTDNVKPVNGKINERIQLPNGIPSGMYMLTLRSETENFISKIVTE